MKEDPAETEILLLDPPDFLHERAAEIWREMAPEMARLGRLDPVHRVQFANWCTWQALFNLASAEVMKEGFGGVTNADGLNADQAADLRNGVQVKASDAWRKMIQASDEVMKLGDRFGTNPKAARQIDDKGQLNMFDLLFDDLEKCA
ncbi:MAG: P27 family phage terminase small subunit [Pseudomonadota bacterium]